jgi:ligand-binding sensor domain-containing protein/serine phosphatase RsbU (regulator of sigma subunit)
MLLKNIRIASIFLTVLFNFTVSSGQKYDFRQYNETSGLSGDVVYSVNQDKHGFLWVGTATDLFRFDGLVFRKVDFPGPQASRFASVIYRDSSDLLWIGASDGTLYYTAGDQLTAVPDVQGQRINDIKESPDGDLFVVTQNNGIYKIPGSDPTAVSHLPTTQGLLLYSVCLLPDGTIFAGTQESLITLKNTGDSVLIDKIVSGIEYIKVNSVIPTADKKGVIAGTEDYGMFYCGIGATELVAERINGLGDFDYLRIQSIFTDREGSYWVSSTGAGVLKLYIDEAGRNVTNIRYYNTKTGLAGDDTKTSFQDNEGNVWIALYGSGLNQLVSEAFTSFQPGKSTVENNILFIGKVGENYLLGTPVGYHLFDLFSGQSLHFERITGSTNGIQATSYHIDNSGAIWIGTGGGLFVKRPGEPIKPFFRALNAGENQITSVTSQNGRLWLSTRSGIIILDSKNGERIRTLTTADKLPHNSINQIYIDRTGQSLVATEASGIYVADIADGIKASDSEISGNIRNVIQGFSQSSDNGYWIATIGNGAFYLSGDSLFALTVFDGLYSNYCYSILADSDNKIWIGHERGFSRFDPDRSSVLVFTTEFADGGDCNPNAIFECPDGLIFIGTTNGVIVYDRNKDLKGIVPPQINIVSVTINDSVYPYQKEYHLPYSKYVVKIEYVGISLSNPELVRYQTKMLNYDTDWSDYTTSRQTTYRLPDGGFKFSVGSVNEAGVESVLNNAFEIVVQKPVWRRWWFVLSLLVTVSVLIFITVWIREENQRKARLALEKELQERTWEVIKQKEEIELQNTEITDSINYARRIQSSILPDVTKLRENFRDAFILFIPRDIVSGDFYWFDKIGDDRFILVCADSTGHGVPGAFMSMIGSTLLQDIISRKNVTRPSEILKLLDEQIFSTLNRNLDVGVSNDGMDMVVCEFNLKTRHLRFASAMRPVIIIMGGEPVYIRGNRSSIGGMSYSEKFFDDQEYYLEEGDTVYLFSDGFPDQFGGEDGKKMKVARLKKLIETLNDIPIDRQQSFITNFFYDWKGDYDQVDDILFMGIRV